MGDNDNAGACICCLLILIGWAIIYEPTRALTIVGIMITAFVAIIYFAAKNSKKKQASSPQSYAPSYSPPQSPVIQAPTRKINCMSCGFVNSYDQEFCGNCGNSIRVHHSPSPPPVNYNPNPAPISASQCIRCGNNLIPGTNFCGKCGTPAKKSDDTQIY
jgi:hypothetical protein